MIWTVMGWLLACHNLASLGAALKALRRDQALLQSMGQRLASRNPYPALLALNDTKQRSAAEQQLVAEVLAGLHEGRDQRPSLEALGALLSVDIEQLSRQRQMTRLLIAKALGIMLSCLSFRLYFLAPTLAAVPAHRSSDLLLCGLSACALIGGFAWWRWQLPKLLSLKLRESGYRAWLRPQDSRSENRREGLAAEPLAQRVSGELKSYRPLAEAQTRKREELMGIVDLGLGGAIAACTLAMPLMGAFHGFGAL